MTPMKEEEAVDLNMKICLSIDSMCYPVPLGLDIVCDGPIVVTKASTVNPKVIYFCVIMMIFSLN